MTNKIFVLPQRSEGGLAASDVFYRSYNDFYFYVEDADQENLYFSVLKNILPNINFEKIFPLGGKVNVLNHAKDPENASLEKKIYILDKDFDDLLGIKENIPGVFYLNKFCIENYFLDSEAIVEVVIESCPKIKREEIQKELCLEEKIPEIGKVLRDLFSLFYFVQMAGLGIPNCRQKPERFCISNRLWEVCPDRLSDYLSQLSDICDKLGIDKPEKPLSSDRRLINFFRHNENEVISGKFWLAMIFNYVKSKYKIGTISFDSFTFRAAKNCNFDELKWFADGVLSIYP